ncbi:hypothetical protein BDR03DRAFT_953010 [Suillus americanus]|nr:hypothetical protein BDR03DRAFT_953010 [Suillus americanus]
MDCARRVPPGFFNDALREANSRTRPPHEPHDLPIPAPRQRTLNPFSSFWRHFKSQRATEPDSQSRSQSLGWTQNLSGLLRRRDGSDIQLREVEVPYTAGKPRNYHARKKNNHIPLPLLRHFPRSLVPRGQREHSRVLIPQLLNGGLVLCAGCVAVSIRDIVATNQPLERRCNITTSP